MNKSESISAIAKALSDFQGEMSAVPRESSNPFYKSKYAELSTIISHIQKLLKKNGLAVSQLCGEGVDKVSVTTLLMHTSGEWLSETVTMTPTKADPQGIGSTITYARRYSLSAMLLLASDEDDDGNVASGKVEKKPEAPKVEPKKAKETAPAEKVSFFDDTEKRNKALSAIAKAKDGKTLDAILSQAKAYLDTGDITEETLTEISKAIDKKRKDLP